MLFEDDVSLNPAHFFAFEVDCYKAPKRLDDLLDPRYLLPSLHDVAGEEEFADVYFGWGSEGLSCLVLVKEALSASRYPDIQKGDAIELFIDTRDVKTSGYTTRFCHHFFFLPKAVDNVDRGELTQFRTDDAHPLCAPERLELHVDKKRLGYVVKIFIPKDCLHGYDVASQFDRLGFSYRVNRADGESQHFAAASEDFKIEQYPSLWNTLKLRS